MRQLENLNKRLKYAGGNQEGRFIKDKLESLRKALLYSYQAATAILKPDTDEPQEFRCLINPDKTKNDYDQNILSIPFEDVCLNAPMIGKTTEGKVPINIKGGDVFKWKETDTYWLVFLRFLEEDAYYRWDIRRCKEVVNINGTEYHIYIRGPVETTIKWLQKKGVSWNALNYSLEIYIEKNEQTLDYFHRFNTIEIGGKMWEVKAKDTYGGDGIIQVLLGETFTNTIEKEEYVEPKPTDQSDIKEPFIKGLDYVKPYDTVEYVVQNLFDTTNGFWKIDNPKVKIIEQDSERIVVDIMTGKSGNFEISYEIDGNVVLTLPVTIGSLI